MKIALLVEFVVMPFMLNTFPDAAEGVIFVAETLVNILEVGYNVRKALVPPEPITVIGDLSVTFPDGSVKASILADTYPPTNKVKSSPVLALVVEPPISYLLINPPPKLLVTEVKLADTFVITLAVGKVVVNVAPKDETDEDATGVPLPLSKIASVV